MKLLTELRASTAATAQLLAATAGPVKLVSVHASNTHTAMTFLQLFDAASAGAVTLGTTVPRLSIGLPAGSSVTYQLDNDLDELEFALGVVYAVTSTSTGNSAPGQPAAVNFFYAKA